MEPDMHVLCLKPARFVDSEDLPWIILEHLKTIDAPFIEVEKLANDLNISKNILGRSIAKLHLRKHPRGKLSYQKFRHRFIRRLSAKGRRFNAYILSEIL